MIRQAPRPRSRVLGWSHRRSGAGPIPRRSGGIGLSLKAHVGVPSSHETARWRSGSRPRMAKNVTLRQAWSGEADCLQCALRQSVLFAGLDAEDFERIHDPIDQYVLDAGAVLYRAGDVGDHMYTIRSGLMKLLQYLPDGGQRIVRLVRATDVLGLESLVAETYQHEAVALQRTEICRFPFVKRIIR